MEISPFVYALGILILGVALGTFLRRQPTIPTADNTFPTVSADPSQWAAELDRVLKFATTAADNAIHWYRVKKEPKQVWGWVLRAGVIVFTAIAGLIPLIAEIFKDANISPGWSTVVLALAGVCLAFDKFAGCTSGWVRFMLAELDLRQRRDAFLFECQAGRMAWKGGAPTAEQTAAMLARARSFVQDVHAVVGDETRVWAGEFQAAIREMDGPARVAVEVKRAGTVNVRVTNGEECAEGWSLSLNGGAAQVQTGQTARLADIAAGPHAIRVMGQIGNKAVSCDKVLSVEAGSIAEVELTLV